MRRSTPTSLRAYLLRMASGSPTAWGKTGAPAHNPSNMSIPPTGGDQAPSTLAWEVISNAAFEEIIARIIVSPAQALRELKTVFVRRDIDGSTLLHVVCGWNNAHELVGYLLDAGIPPDTTDSSGWTPLLEAAQEGQIASCKVLLQHNASPNLALSTSNLTPLRAAAEVGNEEMTQWLMQQPNAAPNTWDNEFFSFLIAKTPGAAAAYMDKFAAVLNHSKRGMRYSDLSLIYGDPKQPVQQTALAMVLQSPHARAILSHRLMKYIIRAKWKIFAKSMFRREFSAYVALLCSYFVPTMWASPDWIHLKTKDDTFVACMRAVSWVCSFYLLLTVERREFLGGGWRTYFRSFWNCLSLITYVLVLTTIPIEFFPKLDEVRHTILALITVSLWINLLQFLQVSTESGLLIAMMTHMVKDVYRFCLLYVVFLLGFSGAFFVLLRQFDDYHSFTRSLISVYRLLFGDIQYDAFQKSTGLTAVTSNLLLFIHLMAVVVILLNILVAMMATTYSDVWESAEAEALQSHAQSIVAMERSLTKKEREHRFYSAIKNHKAKHSSKALVHPGLDHQNSSAVLSTRSNAKRTMLAGIAEKIKAVPFAADARNVVTRTLGSRTASIPGTQKTTETTTVEQIPGAAEHQANLLDNLMGLQLINKTNFNVDLNVLEETLFLKSALDEDDSGGPAGGKELAPLEDGIRYEHPIKKRVEEDTRITVKELREQIEQLHKTVMQLKTQMDQDRMRAANTAKLALLGVKANLAKA